MEVTIEAYAEVYIVKVNGRVIGQWTYLDGAIEAARKELEARYGELTRCTCKRSKQACEIHGIAASIKSFANGVNKYDRRR